MSIVNAISPQALGANLARLAEGRLESLVWSAAKDYFTHAGADDLALVREPIEQAIGELGSGKGVDLLRSASSHLGDAISRAERGRALGDAVYFGKLDLHDAVRALG